MHKTEMDLPHQLANRIWHTTTQSRFASISNDGFILPEPGIPDNERQGTALGPEKYPYVRSIGGVSLFDFRGFEAERYTEKYPFSSWWSFVPCRQEHESAIWVEIRLSQIEESFVDGATLLSDWRNSGELYRKIMPLIECAHIGPIPAGAFGEILFYLKSSQCFESIPNANLA